jgi:hypothetical protein
LKLSYFLEDVYSGKKVNIKSRLNVDTILTKYIDLAYNHSVVGVVKIPKYVQDTAPNGFNPSNLALVFRRFYKALYKGQVNDDARARMLVQIFESVSESENQFLREVLFKKVSFISKREFNNYANI